MSSIGHRAGSGRPAPLPDWLAVPVAPWWVSEDHPILAFEPRLALDHLSPARSSDVLAEFMDAHVLVLAAFSSHWRCSGALMAATATAWLGLGASWRSGSPTDVTSAA